MTNADLRSTASSLSPAPGPYPPAGWIDPAALLGMRSLELRARAVVEGVLSGIHRSPLHGYSVEFTEYRPYVPGDDLRYLDWKLYARSDRYHLKQFEDETNLRCTAVLDASRSMEFGSVGYTKFDYARTLVATLGYFMIHQRDAFGLLRFSQGIDSRLPARFRPGQFRRAIVQLEAPTTGNTTNLIDPLEETARTLHRRGLVIVVSDFLAPLDGVQAVLSRLVARRHEVVVFQILDPAERSLQLDAATLLVDLETGKEMYVDPHTAREQYNAKMQAHCERLHSDCRGLGIDYILQPTDVPLESALVAFLRSRESRVVRR